MGYPLTGDLNADNNTKQVTAVKVLIYSGEGTMSESVNGITDCLNTTNSQNLTPYFYYDYATTNVVTANNLSSYDVLIVPGGDSSSYVKGSSIDSEAIKQFVSGGKGYIGICAGAYAASNQVDGYYSGWGLASTVNTKNVIYEGLIPITITSNGKVLGTESSTVNLHHQNGPAMYSTASDTAMANYSDNQTGYQGYAAIFGVTYGSGRVLLSGSHPEADPQNPLLLARMIL
ncbi:MAG: BPL-N domain-containing protein, partial [Methanobacteriaceae archaeon]|nr:BPL-N domain-containing protein [Methanobacteriaceae archaeon]